MPGQGAKAAANADVLSDDALTAQVSLAKMWRGVSEALSREEAGLPEAFLPKYGNPLCTNDATSALIEVLYSGLQCVSRR